jgi:hypothetical protein
MNAKISARILAAVSNGATLPEAIDAVLGKGSYEKLAGEIYTALRSEG